MGCTAGLQNPSYYWVDHSMYSTNWYSAIRPRLPIGISYRSVPIGSCFYMAELEVGGLDHRHLYVIDDARDDGALHAVFVPLFCAIFFSSDVGGAGYGGDVFHQLMRQRCWRGGSTVHYCFWHNNTHRLNHLYVEPGLIGTPRRKGAKA